MKDSINKAATRCFAEHTGQPLHWHYCTDIMKGSPVDPTVRQSIEMLHSGEMNLRLGRLLLVIGMPVMITHNFDVQSGIVNGSMGTLIRSRYTTDIEGRRHAILCMVHTPSSAKNMLPHLRLFQSVVLEDSVEIMLNHPHSKQAYKFRQTQVAIIPSFAMTAHKSQGLTLSHAIVDIESCFGSKAPYVMLSRVKSLETLLILRPFSFKHITCRRSEDARREDRQLEILSESSKHSHTEATVTQSIAQ